MTHTAQKQFLKLIPPISSVVLVIVKWNTPKTNQTLPLTKYEMLVHTLLVLQGSA